MTIFIGIDISAKTFDLVVRSNEKNQKSIQFAQTAQGHKNCAQYLLKLNPQAIVMEATGVYYLDLALVLDEHQLPVSVINPLSFKRFAELTLTHSKTDGVDAALLAEYAQRMPLRKWIAPSDNALALRDIGRFIQRLTRENTREKNRLHALKAKSKHYPLLIDELEAGIELTIKRLQRLREMAFNIIQSDETLNLTYRNMIVAKGIGENTAIAILGEFGVLPTDMKANQVSKHAGLDVRLTQSGTSVNGASRISKAGNAYLRTALYLPIMSAVRHDSNAHAFREALVGRGKKKIQANVAVMRKYLTGLWAVYKSGEAFDSSKLFSEIHKQV